MTKVEDVNGAKMAGSVCRALRICVDVIHLEGLITKAFDTEGGFALHICNFFLRICKLACGRRLLLLVGLCSF
jgi:hypothetical protein